MITDVTRYQEFVPFCVKSRILPDNEGSADESENVKVFYAEMAVGFDRFNDSYVSKVTVHGKERIEAEAVDSSIFNHLKSVWKLTKVEDGRVLVEFSVDFEFASYIYAYAANIFFIGVSKDMVAAFKKRAAALAHEKIASSEVD